VVLAAVALLVTDFLFQRLPATYWAEVLRSFAGADSSQVRVSDGEVKCE
jgi:hypothetical protein